MTRAANYFRQSQEYGCMLGHHWLGIFHIQGKWLSKNVDKAFELFTTAAKMGNCQSEYQLYLIHALHDGYKDPIKAYKHL